MRITYEYSIDDVTTTWIVVSLVSPYSKLMCKLESKQRHFFSLKNLCGHGHISHTIATGPAWCDEHILLFIYSYMYRFSGTIFLIHWL